VTAFLLWVGAVSAAAVVLLAVFDHRRSRRIVRGVEENYLSERRRARA